MKGTPTQLTCRGTFHGYPQIYALTSLNALIQEKERLSLHIATFLSSG
jgi:hypothetical protein